MEKDRNTKIVAVIALFVALIGVSVGFAAFTRDLVINVTGNVTTADNFNIQFSEEANALTTGHELTQTAESTGTGTATISTTDTKITDVEASFTAPGQSVTLEFFVVNPSAYDAYLKKILFSQNEATCSASPVNGATQNIQDVCDSMTMSVTVGSNTANYLTAGINAEGLTVTQNNKINKFDDPLYGSELVTIVLTYGNTNSAVADGGIDVNFGNITLSYSTAQ